MAGSFDGKVALVTGAALGVGAAIAAALAEEGAAVGLIDVDAAALEKTVAEINATGVGSDLANSRIALVRNLLKTNRMSLDSLGLGPRIAADNALLDAQDQASDWIFGLGPIARSRYWEIAAVPDIRLQVEQLVARLLSKPSISATRARRPPLYSTNR